MTLETAEVKEEFYTFVLVGDPSESSLISSIPNFNQGRPLPAKEVTSKYLFDLTVGDAPRPRLRASTAAKQWLFAEAERYVGQVSRSEHWGHPDEFLVMSFAPRKDIERVWRQVCSYDKKYYQFLPVRFGSGCPYQHRLLVLRYLGKAIPHDTKPMGIEFPIVEDGERISPSLWPHLIRIPLSSDRARDLFLIDERENIDPNSRLGVNATRGSLFLPPVRSMDTQAEALLKRNSYFITDRVDLRKTLLQGVGALVYRSNDENLLDSLPALIDREAPLNVQALHFMDDPLVRDVLLDGGRVSVDGQEGTPTKLVLQFVGNDISPYAYRRRFFQDDPEDWRLGPDQFKMLRRRLQNDLRELPHNGLDLSTLPPDAEPCQWLCRLNQQYQDTSDPGPGAWEKLMEMSDHMESATSTVKNTFHRLVIDEPGKLGSRTSADNDLAEKLFITNVWRYPSGDDVLPSWADEPPQNRGWRLGVVEQLLESELKPGVRLVGPQERVSRWNAENLKAHFIMEREGDHWVFEVSGSEDEAELWKHRFLLPLGSILISKTLILNHKLRSRLDAGHRLG